MQDEHRLLTATDLQRLLGVDTSTIYRMAADGRLPAVKVGRQWRFPAGAIEERFGPVPTERATATTPADLQGIIDFAATALGIMMVVTDMSGQPITAVANPCPRYIENVDDPKFVEACAAEWADLAGGPDLIPRFVVGSTGFACARTFIRNGTQLTAMVLAGGLACPDGDDDDLHHLTDDERARVLESLPHLAALLSASFDLNQSRSNP